MNGIHGKAMLNCPMFVVLKCDYTRIHNVRDALQCFNLHYINLIQRTTHTPNHFGENLLICNLKLKLLYLNYDAHGNGK